MNSTPLSQDALELAYKLIRIRIPVAHVAVHIGTTTGVLQRSLVKTFGEMPTPLSLHKIQELLSNLSLKDYT